MWKDLASNWNNTGLINRRGYINYLFAILILQASYTFNRKVWVASKGERIGLAGFSDVHHPVAHLWVRVALGI
jgi:hypothetical protein